MVCAGQMVVVRQARSRESSGLICRLPRAAQTTLTWVGTTQAPLHLFIIGWDSPGSSLPID
jgi:hypothetical protein